MDRTHSTELSRDDIDEFLGAGGTGVLSFSTEDGDPPYSVPVSYGYDTTTLNFYLRLGVGTDGEKEALLEAGHPVSLVVHDREDGRWRSVVASGRLEEITESEINSEPMQALQRVEIPLVDVFDRHPDEMEFRFFRLDPDELSGRSETTARE